MTLDRIKYVLVGFLVLVLLLLLFNPPKKSGRQGPDVVSAQVQDFQEVFSRYSELMMCDVKFDSIDAVKKKYDVLAISRNPFAFLVPVHVKTSEIVQFDESEEKLPKFEIEGILYDANNPRDSVAIVGGEELRPGDKILDWEILRITEKSLIMGKGRAKQEAKLYQKE